MFSINASLRRVLAATTGCPFVPLFSGAATETRRPGDPMVCLKCPLGVDTSSNVEGGLMHHCRVYLLHHTQWLELPEARTQMHR
jgi:hypothetical protein